MRVLTQEYLKSILRYDGDSGYFYWLIDKRPIKRAGDVAGRINNLGYCQITIDQKYYHAHRLAWLYVYGIWPSKFLDHIDRNRSNNRIENLREAERSENRMNSSFNRNNTSGAKGVFAYHGKWRAQLSSKSLGSFKTIAEAHAAYLNAAKERYGEFACGS